MAINTEILADLTALAAAVSSETAVGGNTHQRLGQALDDIVTLLTELADGAGGVAGIALADIDSVPTGLNVKDGAQARFYVYAPDPSGERYAVVGTLDVWASPDSSGSGAVRQSSYYQLFSTCLTVNDDGGFDIYHSSTTKVYQYWRVYMPGFSWDGWTQVF